MRGPWTPNLAEARAWRVDAMARLQAGTLSAVTGPTIRDAADEFLTGIRSGAIRNRSGRPYKPSVVGSYEHHLRERVVPTFGATRLAKLTRPDVQRWIDTLAAGNLAANTVANAITPLRAIYVWAEGRGMVHSNPCVGVRLPKGEKARDRIASPSEAAALIAALPAEDQAALGLAVYAGLRMGEVLALDWSGSGPRRSRHRAAARPGSSARRAAGRPTP